MLKPPVAHDGYGKVAKGLWRWAVAPLVLALLCLVTNLANMHLLFNPYDKSDRARLDVSNLQNAIARYRQRHGVLPPVESWAFALVSAQILEREPVDPWNRPYRYRFASLDGGAPEPILSSDGRDGEEGTSDDIISEPERLRARSFTDAPR